MNIYNSNIPRANGFLLISIVHSIPSEWRALAKASTNVVSLSATIPSTPTIKTDNVNLTPMFDVQIVEAYLSIFP